MLTQSQPQARHEHERLLSSSPLHTYTAKPTAPTAARWSLALLTVLLLACLAWCSDVHNAHAGVSVPRAQLYASADNATAVDILHDHAQMRAPQAAKSALEQHAAAVTTHASVSARSLTQDLDGNDGSKGVFFFAVAGAVKEVYYPARRIRQLHPELQIALLTDTAGLGELRHNNFTWVFDQIQEFQAPTEQKDYIPTDKYKTRFRFDFMIKVAALMLTPFYNTIYMDADTYVCAPHTIPSMFDALNRWDFATTAAKHLDPPRTFPQPNTGVIAYRQSVAVRRMMYKWLEHMTDETLEDYGHEQTSLMKVADRCTDVRWMTLPIQFNCKSREDVTCDATINYGTAVVPCNVLHAHGIRKSIPDYKEAVKGKPDERPLDDTLVEHPVEWIERLKKDRISSSRWQPLRLSA